MSRYSLVVMIVAIGIACRGGEDETPWTPPPGTIVVKDVGFRTPESVLHDPDLDYYFVSNINGSPTEADDNGFISVLSPAGEMLALKGIDGAAADVSLHAPKGMAVSGTFLYVADLNVIRRFDRHTGKSAGEIAVPGATYLNDVVADLQGNVYFTDGGLRAGAGGLEPSGTDAVYRFTPEGTLDTLARGIELGNPNGVAVSGDTVWVVGFGSGELYRVANGRKTGVRKLRTGGLDGLVVFEGDAFVSSWEGKRLFRGKLGGEYRLMLDSLDAPADIGHDLWRNRLLIPLFNANEVRIVPLVALSAAPTSPRTDTKRR